MSKPSILEIFENLLRVVKSVKDQDLFDLSVFRKFVELDYYTGDCGSVCCIIGHACLDSQFNSWGLVYPPCDTQQSELIPHHVPTNNKGYAALSALLGLLDTPYRGTYGIVGYLCNPSFYIDFDVQEDNGLKDALWRLELIVRLIKGGSLLSLSDAKNIMYGVSTGYMDLQDYYSFSDYSFPLDVSEHERLLIEDINLCILFGNQ